MAGAKRRASAVWNGSLAEGSGKVSTGTGVLRDVPVTWAARTGGDDAKTSPEELLAAAHAACFSMALAAGLGKSGNPPEELRVEATCSFAPKPEGGFRIGSIELQVRGRVPDIDQNAFEQAARAAGEGCPVSAALEGNVQVRVAAQLS
ncbi:MAG: OsmC family peroxiredoxin [Longimicrobiales bacterium]